MPHGPRSADCEVAVIGAGPYGLSVAAHLKAAGVETRVFGDPMSFWRQNMPRGMRLRSPHRATSLSDPAKTSTLDAYAAHSAASVGEQIPIETFVDYGLWFQNRVAPDVDRRMVSSIGAAPGGFVVELAEGGAVGAKRVVVATGLKGQQSIPAAFADLPAEYVSHTCAHADLSIFRGKRVAVVGRGQSAVESAVLLREAGAEAELIARGPINWLGGANAPGPWRTMRGMLGEALAAPSAIGPFPLNWLVEAPTLIRLMPDEMRDRFSQRALRAAAAGWLRPRLNGVALNPGRDILAAAPEGDRLALQLDDGRAIFDHVLLATGYLIDIAKLGLLAPDLINAVSRRNGAPILQAGLESNIPGLHFVGASAVASFGPKMRFIAGAAFAATLVTRAVTQARGAEARPLPRSVRERALASGEQGAL